MVFNYTPVSFDVGFRSLVNVFRKLDVMYNVTLQFWPDFRVEVFKSFLQNKLNYKTPSILLTKPSNTFFYFLRVHHYS